MAEFSFDPQNFGSIAEIQDYIVGLTRKLNYGMTHLDSLNVKRINTNQTIIKSSDGYMDLTGEQIKMYDVTGDLRFRVGLSSLGVYDMTMWSSNAATTDYDASSNASMYINSSGEAVFADTIRTKKDAIVGRNLYVGYSNSTEVKAVRLQAYDPLIGREQDLIMRSAYDGLGLLNLEFGMLYSSENSSNPLRDIDSVNFYTFGGFNIHGQYFSQIGIGAGFTQIGSDTNLNISVGTLNDMNLFARDIILSPYQNGYLKTTDSTSKIATEGYVNASINTLGFNADLYAKNFSSDRQIVFDASTVHNGLAFNMNSTGYFLISNFGGDTNHYQFVYTAHASPRFYQNGIAIFTAAQVVNSTRNIQFDLTTAEDNFLIYRNSTHTANAVLSPTGKVIKLDYSTASTDSLEVMFDSTRRSIVLGSDTTPMRFGFSAGLLQFYYNGINQVNVPDQASIVQNLSSNRRISFDFTTADDNLLVGRNTTQLKSVVLSNTTQALRLDWSTATALPSIVSNSTIVAYLVRSAGQAHRFEWNAGSTHLNLQVAGVSVANFIDKIECVRNVSTARQIRLDVETTGAFQWLQVVLNSTSAGYPVMAYSAAQKLSMQHLTLATTAGSVLQTSGEYILVYSSGVFKGGLRLDT